MAELIQEVSHECMMISTPDYSNWFQLFDILHITLLSLGPHSSTLQCEDEESTGFIKYERFEPMMTRVLLAKKWVIA